MAIGRAPRHAGPVRAVARVAASLVALTAVAATATPVMASVLNHTPSAFEATIGLTRSQVEARFHEIDGGHTVFKPAAAVAGVPRVLG